MKSAHVQTTRRGKEAWQGGGPSLSGKLTIAGVHPQVSPKAEELVPFRVGPEPSIRSAQSSHSKRLAEAHGTEPKLELPGKGKRGCPNLLGLVTVFELLQGAANWEANSCAWKKEATSSGALMGQVRKVLSASPKAYWASSTKTHPTKNGKTTCLVQSLGLTCCIYDIRSDCPIVYGQFGKPSSTPVS